MANVDSNTYYMKGQILFCNKKKTKTKTKTKHSDFTKKLSETDKINIYFDCLTCFTTDSRHTYGCNLSSYSRRLVPFFGRDIFHTEVSQEKPKGARSFNFTSFHQIIIGLGLICLFFGV
jgi:hypothetical protein